MYLRDETVGWRMITGKIHTSTYFSYYSHSQIIPYSTLCIQLAVFHSVSVYRFFLSKQWVVVGSIIVLVSSNTSKNKLNFLAGAGTGVDLIWIEIPDTFLSIVFFKIRFRDDANFRIEPTRIFFVFFVILLTLFSPLHTRRLKSAQFTRDFVAGISSSSFIIYSVHTSHNHSAKW